MTDRLVNTLGIGTERAGVILLTLVLTAASTVAAQDDHLPIVLSVPPAWFAARGDIYHIPVSASEILASDDVTNFGMTVTYPPEALKIVGVQMDSDAVVERGELLLSQKAAAPTRRITTPGRVRVVWAQTNNISGEGVLFYLDFIVLETARAESVMTIGIEPLDDMPYFPEVGVGPPAVAEPGEFVVLRGVGVTEVPEPEPFTITAWPNPFNAEVSVAYTGMPGEDVEIVAANALGTIVRRWRRSGSGRLSWDGTDERGRSVGSGVYFVVATVRTGRSAIKVTLLR